jgi:hypothetical protein
MLYNLKCVKGHKNKSQSRKTKGNGTASVKTGEPGDYLSTPFMALLSVVLLQKIFSQS